MPIDELLAAPTPATAETTDDDEDVPAVTVLSDDDEVDDERGF